MQGHPSSESLSTFVRIVIRKVDCFLDSSWLTLLSLPQFETELPSSQQSLNQKRGQGTWLKLKTSQKFLYVTHHQRALPYCNRPLLHSAKEKASDAPRKYKHSKRTNVQSRYPAESHPTATSCPLSRHPLPWCPGISSDKAETWRQQPLPAICHPAGLCPSAKLTPTHLSAYLVSSENVQGNSWGFVPLNRKKIKPQ